MIYTISTDFDALKGAYIEERGEHPFGGFIQGERLEDWDGKPLHFATLPSNDADPTNPIPWDYIDYAHLMSKRLLKSLQDAGVENLEVVPTVIKADEGAWSTDDYVAVNVLGGIHNEATELDKDGHLVSNADRVPPLELFLWAPGVFACKEKVATVIQDGNFSGVILTPVESKL